MGLFDGNNSLQSRIDQSVQQQAQSLNYLSNFISIQARKIYGSGTGGDAEVAAAQAWVAGLGTNAVTQFEVSQIIVTALNQIAGLTGLSAIPSPMPAGYTLVPNADGTATLSYAKPTPTPTP